jgi:hypothetical protein
VQRSGSQSGAGWMRGVRRGSAADGGWLSVSAAAAVTAGSPLTAVPMSARLASAAAAGRMAAMRHMVGLVRCGGVDGAARWAGQRSEAAAQWLLTAQWLRAVRRRVERGAAECWSECCWCVLVCSASVRLNDCGVRVAAGRPDEPFNQWASEAPDRSPFIRLADWLTVTH